MDEQLIRKQTSILLEAYKELTGSTDVLKIEDFLKLRETAIKESKMELESFTSPVERISRETKPVRNREQRQTEAHAVKLPDISKDKEKEAVPVKTSQTTKAEVYTEERPLAKDAFTMLRDIQDPWNG